MLFIQPFRKAQDPPSKSTQTCSFQNESFASIFRVHHSTLASMSDVIPKI